ncbi:MAG TPA: Gfo/Idh/MocA family oxidoreductase, partial [Anaerolineaceae bacterium]|nr:Gfo/Idh/MocA family oxidoreductase [Anaerolineaceae bacterium]
AAMTVRILQVGMGVRGRQWAEVIRTESCAVNVGYMRPELDIARRQVIEWGEPDTPVFDDLETAIRTLQPDAVLLVTPPDGHHDQASLAFKYGCHVLCEKPLTEDLDESIDLVRQADEAGKLLMVGMNFRYLGVSQKTRQMLHERALGEPGFGHFVYLRNRDGRRPDLNKFPLTMRQPMLLEQSVHHLDLMRYCYDDEVVAVQADTWNPSWSTYADDSCVSALLEFRSGLRANYLGTWTSGWNRFCFEWRTDCSGGVLIQKQQFEELYQAKMNPESALTGELFKTGPEIEPLQPVAVETTRAFYDDTRGLLREFAAAVEGRAPLVTSGKDHLKTLGLVLACAEAARQGRRLLMADFYRQQGIPDEWL